MTGEEELITKTRAAAGYRSARLNLQGENVGDGAVSGYGFSALNGRAGDGHGNGRLIGYGGGLRVPSGGGEGAGRNWLYGEEVELYYVERGDGRGFGYADGQGGGDSQEHVCERIYQ